MSVITRKKPEVDVEALLASRADLAAVVVGCDKCAKTSRTGGAEQVGEWKARLRAGPGLAEPEGLVDAVEEGLCDPAAVARRLAPLAALAGRAQVLVLSCGAGLRCVSTALPGLRVVPGLDTLGPGVKDELACLACGDCRFDSGRCRMVAVARAQAEALAASYGAER